MTVTTAHVRKQYIVDKRRGKDAGGGAAMIRLCGELWRCGTVATDAIARQVVSAVVVLVLSARCVGKACK